MQAQPTHQLKVLKEGVHLLPKGDQGFAASLLTHYENRGIMVTIDATQPPDAVLVAILHALAPLETQ